MNKKAKLTAVYSGGVLQDVYIRYRKETPSGFIWAEEKLPAVPEILEIKEAQDYEDKPTISIRAYGKLEKVFQ